MRGRSSVVSILWFIGMLAVFIGERLVGAGPWRWLTLVGVALVVASLGLRALRWRKAPADRRGVESMLLGLGSVGALALVAYFIQSDLSAALLGRTLDRAAPRAQVALAALWPVLWLAAALPTLLVEFAYAAVARAPHLEVGRVRDAALSGLGLAGALVFAFSATYVATARDQKIDLSYAKTARPGESTRKLVHALDKPVTVGVFFPPANEVREQVRSYFRDLAAESQLLELGEYDHAVDIAKARDLGVTGNGTIVIARGSRREQISVGLELEGARYQLANLDKDVQKRLLLVARPERVVYLSTGHGERGIDPAGESAGLVDKRATIRDLRELLTDQGYQVRNLGAAEGLAAEVPGDAAVVIVIGPSKPFMAEEIAAITRYLERGGRLLVALDPEAQADYKELLAPLGLKFNPIPLANDQVFGRRTYQDSDRINLITGAFSSHPSVSTLSRLGGRAPMVLVGAGAFEERPDKPKDAQVVFTVHSHQATWADRDGNFKFDPPPAGAKPDEGEARRTWEMAAAVTRKVAVPAGADASKAAAPQDGKNDGKDGKDAKDAKDAKDKKPAEAPEGRALVIGDSDAISDGVLRAYGNPGFVLDGMRWLLGEESLAGEVSTEVDQPIAHTRKQDVAWFYSTVFLAPAVMLGIGFLATRRRRRARKPGGRSGGEAQQKSSKEVAA